MATYGILIRLSPKRLEQLREEPELLQDILDERDDEEIPGLLDLGKGWDALDIILSDRGKDAVLGDALIGRSGKKLYPDGPDSIRLLGAERVAEISKQLGALGTSVVRDRFGTLAGKNVVGKLGKDPEDAKGLEHYLAKVITLYSEAAQQKHSMLCIII